MNTFCIAATREFLQALKGSIWFWVVLALHILVPVLFLQMPMFDLLDYESSLGMATIHGFLMAALVAVVARRLPQAAAPLFFPQFLVLSWVLLFPGFLMLFAATLRACPAGWQDGLLFWFFYPAMTGVVTTALIAGLCGFFHPVSRKGVLLCTLVPFISLGVSLVRLYLEPPVFMHDPFFGFYSGAFYDRLIEIQTPFVWARIQHLGTGLALLAAAATFRGLLNRGAGWILTTGAGMVAIVLYLFSPAFGIRFDAASMERRMGHLLETEHFRIVYSADSDPESIARLAVQAQWHHRELVRFFGEAPARRTTIYHFANGREKRRYFGTLDVEVAKPWQNAVFITAAGFPHPSLRHELAHVYAGIWGDPVFRIAWSRYRFGFLPVRLPDPGIIEGVAVAADAVMPDEDLHAQAALLLKMGGYVPMNVLFSPQFYTVASSRAYVQAGSFLRYVVETRGIGPVRELYRGGGPLRRVFPDLDDLESGYRSFLETVTIPAHEEALARERFSRPPLHRQRCVHAVARARRKAVERTVAGDESCADRAILSALRMDPDSLETWMMKLVLARRSRGSLEAHKAALAVLRLSGDAGHLQIRALLVKAEIAWQGGDNIRAMEYLDRAAAVPAVPGVLREVALLRFLVSWEPVQTRFFRVLFTHPVPPLLWQLALARLPPHPVMSYLAASSRLLSGEPEDAGSKVVWCPGFRATRSFIPV